MNEYPIKKCLLLNSLDFTGSSQRKGAAMLDTDDSDSVSSTSTSRSENMLMSGADELQLDRESFLDQCVDALYEKRCLLSVKFIILSS